MNKPQFKFLETRDIATDELCYIDITKIEAVNGYMHIKPGYTGETDTAIRMDSGTVYRVKGAPQEHMKEIDKYGK